MPKKLDRKQILRLIKVAITDQEKVCENIRSQISGLSFNQEVADIGCDLQVAMIELRTLATLLEEIRSVERAK